MNSTTNTRLGLFTVILIGLFILSGCFKTNNGIARVSHRNAAFISQGLIEAQQLKITLYESYVNEGKLLCGGEKRLKHSEIAYEKNHSSVWVMKVTDCGEITIVFNEKSGVEGGIITLNSTEIALQQGFSGNWECKTKDYPGIEKFIPQCQYRPDLDI